MADAFCVLTCVTLLLLIFGFASGTVCLACTDSPITRECLYTMTCESHESCYADAFENPNGDIIFNMGCRDNQLCGPSGKREVVNRSSGNTLLCSQCCTGNICNAALCGQTGLPSVGPVCFHCDQANTPSSCNTIALCGRDDVCYVEKIIGSLTQATLYKSGCLHKAACDKHAHSLSIIGRRYDNTVMSGNELNIQCCDAHLCNHGNGSSSSGSAVTTGSVAPTHGSLSTNQSPCSSNPCIHGNCFAGSADYICQCEQGWQGKNCDQLDVQTTPAPATGNCKRDVVFVFDQSGSIGESNFRLSIKFANEILEQMYIGNDRIHTAAVTYSSRTQIVWTLSYQQTLTSMKSFLSGITYHGGVTNTNYGLETVYRSIFTTTNGDRLDADNVVILFSDGNSNHPAETLQWATSLKRITGHMFVVAMDMIPGYNLQELSTLATDNWHVIQPFGATTILKDVPGIINLMCQ